MSGRRPLGASTSPGRDSVSSDSSAEPPPRKKRLRVEPITDDESDGPGTTASFRRCRPLETDGSGDDSTADGSDDDRPPNLTVGVPQAAQTAQERGWQSDSSEGDSDKCPVCLLKLAGQEIGTPDACDHAFCSDCLIEWSNHVNTCPVDRKEFASVLVRKEPGGRVIRTMPVKPRRISLDELVEEQPTVCQICRSAESEETMLLCDMCDLGFHMECLNPPLDEVPLDDWYCPTCAGGNGNFWADENQIALLASSSRGGNSQPFARRGIAPQADGGPGNAPSTSSQSGSGAQRASGAVRSSARPGTSRRPRRTRKKRRTAKTVIIEYEIRNGEKFPSKRKYVSKKRKKKGRRRVPRTVARRALVRTSVRGRLAELLKTSGSGSFSTSLSNIVAPQFSLFGNRDELDYVVSDEESTDNTYSGGGAAVAVAPRFRTSALLEAHRQSRRKLISIPSPSYASSAPDLLSSIMESQSLLHSKKSMLSLKNDGSIVIELPLREDVSDKKTQEKNVDVTNPSSSEGAKEVPAYGSGRGGSGGGNWRGNRSDYQSGGNQNRNNHSYTGGTYQGSGQGNYWEGNNYSNENFSGQGNAFFNSNRSWSNNNSGRAPQRDSFPNFSDRSPQQRNAQNNRGRGNQSRHSSQLPQRTRNFPSWEQQNYSDASPHYNERTHSESYQPEISLPNPQLENAIDRVNSESVDDGGQLGVYEISDLSSSSTGHLPPQPPIIRFKKPTMSDEGNSENETKTDTDKYDPTEPTLDDSSTDDEANVSKPAQQRFTIVSPPHKNYTDPDVSDICAPTDSLNISPERLDHAVQQVLKEHENLLSACSIEDQNKEMDSDGDDGCPNFSIYSSTSMDIAKGKNDIVESKEEEQINMVSEDLVQEDDCDFSDSELHVNATNTDGNYQKVENPCANLISNEKIEEDGITANNTTKFSSSVASKFLPKRNIIKINLSSSLGIKKRLLDNDNEKDINDKKEGSSLILERTSYSSLQVGNLRSHNDLNLNSPEMEKDAEFISDVDDERSYTPCLDENKSVKSKDTSVEGSEKENGGIEGLDTELISEDEGNELFSDTNHRYNSGKELHLRQKEHATGDCEEGEIIEKNKQKIKAIVKELLEKPEEKISDDEKKRKRRDRRGDKDDKEKTSKGKSKKDAEALSFKKLSKSGKERNYRERDDKNKKTKERRHSRSIEKEKKEKRKEKRKDMERYDVRNIISDRSRRIKDAFGRDKSRPKSNSPDSRITSPSRYRRSSSRKRSVSRRKSVSRSRRSVSRRSNSKSARSKSPHRQSNLPLTQNRTAARGLRSVSRDNRSSSLRMKRSISRHRSISPKKSISPKNRSPPRQRSPCLRARRSVSPRLRRSRSPRNRRSASRNRNRRKTSVTRGRRVSPRIGRPKSPVRRRLSRRSRSKARSTSRNHSKSPKLKKQHKLKRNRSNSRCKSKSPIKSKLKRKRSRSFSPTLALSRSLSRDRVHQQNWHEAEKSPLYQDWTSRSQSMSPRNLMSPGWTPPPMEKSPEPRNLRVILTTKEKNRKKEKKKKITKKIRGSDRILKHQTKDSVPSKEVFTSGNNILVSVSFNKNKDTEKAPIITPDAVSKKKKKKNETSTKQKKDKAKEKLKKKRFDKEKRSKELENKKPVAIIDLDKSPFKELTPSPKAVIVLSDSDTGEKEEEVIVVQTTNDKVMDPALPQPDVESLPCSPSRENNYVTPAGPKTPPEPSIKFTIMSKSNPQMRTVNPLHEDEDDLNEDQETTATEDPQNKISEPVHKGPNTPPDPPNSPPSSPDAYDPFEPTKSGSVTPERAPSPPSQVEGEKLPESKIDDLPQISCMSLEAAQKSNLQLDDVIQTKPISPTEKVMALLKSTRASLSPGNSITQIFGEQSFETLKPAEPEPVPAVMAPALSSPEGSNTTITLTNKVSQAQITYSAIIKPSSPKPVYSTVAPTIVTSTPIYFNPSVPRIGIFSMASSPSAQRIPLSIPPKITLPSPTKSSPLKSQPPKIFMSKPSPIKSTPIKPILSKTIISKLPMPTIKSLPARNQKLMKTPTKSSQNGSELTVIDMDMDSPYSPGSSDFGDLFDPPSDNGKHTAAAPQSYPQKSSHKIEPFDTLFSIKSKSASRVLASSNKVSVKQMKKPKGKTIVGVTIDDDNLKILDELPSSAVEMQVKTKFLKKLNRQERVVEEVKLVLKPHYNKKHITKDEYKDILRRAVPKICHNRSGEINPTKIQALIEAYVKKFRKKAHLQK